MAQPTIITKAYVASRSVPLAVNATGTPSTLDEATRSIEVIASTEAPAWVMDWEHCEMVQEVLLMSGCRMPANGQVPLLDSHSRGSVAHVLGSFREINIASTQHGSSLIGRTYYSSVKEAEDTFIKVKEGHVTDVSIGYSVEAHIWLKEGETTVIEGKTFTGPLRIATEWSLFELSPCPIGADANAKFRSHNTAKNISASVAEQKKEKSMSKSASHGKRKTARRSGLMRRLRSLLASLGIRSAEDDENQEQDISLVDEQGNPNAGEELSEEQLATVVEVLEEVVAVAEDELESSGEEKKRATRENEDDEDDEEEKENADNAEQKSSRKKNTRSRSLSPAQVAQVERARITAIRNLAKAHHLSSEMEQQFIDNGTSLTAVKAKVLDMRSNNTSHGGVHISMGATGHEKFRSAAQDALLLRAGISVKKPSAGAEDLQNFSLREIARELCQQSGQRVSGHIGELVSRALTTTDLPHLLVDTSRRVLLDAFETTEETYKLWCSTGSVQDFKKTTAVGLEGDTQLRKKLEEEEYKKGKLSEVAEEYQIETFGRKMVFPRESIINDDLGALVDQSRLYGESAARLVGDVAYAALLSTPNRMGDNNELFHKKHGNLHAKKGGIPTVENLGDIVTAMKTQKDSFGKNISIMPKFFIAPIALETASEQFFNTSLQGPIIGTQAQPLAYNPYGGTYFTRVYDYRLDNANIGDYYLAAARNTVKVFFLGGVESPYIENQINFDSDGIETKIRMDVGAKALRWNTLAKATKA